MTKKKWRSGKRSKRKEKGRKEGKKGQAGFEYPHIIY
jgi:hypothetical protein